MEHVTREQVIDAALAVLRRERSLGRVTLERVREQLGGRGSWSTIAPALREWRDKVAASRIIVEDADVVVITSAGDELKLSEPGAVQADVDAHGRLNVVVKVKAEGE